MSKRLDNKVAIVTGGASGIGEATCVEFAKQGAKVVVTDIDKAGAQSVADLIKEQGGNAIALPLDVSCENNWLEVIEQVKAQLGGLDVLVNNAGIAFLGNAESTTLEEWKITETVNVHGVFLGMKHAIKLLDETGGGSIINVSSIDGLVGDSQAIAYNASKGSVRLMSKSAALHCAYENRNVRVNSIHPGYILTPLVERELMAAPKEYLETYTTRKINNIPCKQMGEPLDIAMGCVYLASDEAKYVNGSELVIDGGFTAA